MASVKPFKAIIAKQELIPFFSATAYEIPGRTSNRLHGFNLSYLRVVKPQEYFEEELTQEQCYDEGKKNLQDFFDREVIRQQKEPCYFIYEQEKGGHIFKGIIAACSVEEYNNGLIKKHEKTRQDKEDEITGYFQKVKVNGSPVLITYEAVNEIDNIISEETLQKAFAAFTDEQEVTHKLWHVCSESNVKRIRQAFEKVPALYIADGHHRCAAAARTADDLEHVPGHEPVGIMCYLVGHNNLKIYSYNRLVKLPEGLDEEKILKKLEEYFFVQKFYGETFEPSQKEQIGMYFNKHWYKLLPKEKFTKDKPSVEQLDVAILEHYVLQPIFHIKDSRTDRRIRFLHGSAGIEALQRQADYSGNEVAFALHPISAEEIMKVSHENGTMPPKSTWIEPKLRSGLILHSLK